ncbi:MAG: class I SAM-dependent methyltransferase [bacterium]
MYYSNKETSLRDIFGAQEVSLSENSLIVDQKKYPIINDVIICADPSEYTPYVKQCLQIPGVPGDSAGKLTDFSEDIQYSFGEEWKMYNTILHEHEKEFLQYFDMVNLPELADKRLCDLGCGNGRWSYFLKNLCKEIVLVDFSDAIFVARNNLQDSDVCLYVMCDLRKLPFRNEFADFMFSLGVLHHLPAECIEETRKLKKFSKKLLVFLYYALDNRPIYFKIILHIITGMRLILSRVRNGYVRKIITLLFTYAVYLPLICIGKLLRPLKLSSAVPLYDFYKDKSILRIKQDVYDRFFTHIEQRVTRKQILALQDTFAQVKVSPELPYWHFLCTR